MMEHNAAYRHLKALGQDHYVAKNFADELYGLGSIINEMYRLSIVNKPSDDLLPCPFCGDNNLGHASDCYMALCRLPELPSPDVMEAAWNRRATHPQPVTPAGGEVEAVAYMLRRKRDGYFRGYSIKPTDEQMEVAAMEGDEYAPLYTHPPVALERK